MNGAIGGDEGNASSSAAAGDALTEYLNVQTATTIKVPVMR
jgi:hypothetical protein